MAHVFESLCQRHPVHPSRAGEIRTVEFIEWDELTELRRRKNVGDWAKSKQRNAITKRPSGGRQEGVGGGGCWTVYLTSYKTAKWKGVDVMELDANLFRELCSALDTYLLGDSPLRVLLQPLGGHRFLLMTTTGSALSSNYFAAYLSTLVERHTGARPTASMLRSSFISTLLDSEAGADMRNREAIAEQLRHSVREQSRTYDRRSRQHKKRRALELASSSSAPAPTPTAPAPVPLPETTLRPHGLRVDRVERALLVLHTHQHQPLWAGAKHFGDRNTAVSLAHGDTWTLFGTRGEATTKSGQ